MDSDLELESGFKVGFRFVRLHFMSNKRMELSKVCSFVIALNPKRPTQRPGLETPFSMEHMEFRLLS
jgi:hypothetical protein